MEYQMYMIGWSFYLFLHWLETQVNQHFKILAIVDTWVIIWLFF